jgi:hypothetical protein
VLAMGAAPVLASALAASLTRSQASFSSSGAGLGGGGMSNASIAAAAEDPVATPALRCLGNLASVDEATATHVLQAPATLPALVTILAGSSGG